MMISDHSPLHLDFIELFEGFVQSMRYINILARGVHSKITTIQGNGFRVEVSTVTKSGGMD